MSRIQLKMMTTIGALLAAVALTTVWVTIQNLHRHVHEQFEHDALQKSELAGMQLAALDPHTPDGRAQIQAIATKIEARLTLTSTDGELVADVTPANRAPGAVASLPANLALETPATSHPPVAVSVRRSAGADSPRLWITLPAAPPERPWLARFAFDLSPIVREIASARREAMIAAGLTALCLLLAAYPLTGLFLRPLDEIREILANLARGGAGRRLRWKRSDELGDVADSLNRLGESMQLRVAQAMVEREQLEAVLGSMVEGVLVTDHNHRIVLANSRVRELFGSRESVDGRAPIELIRDPEIDAALREAAISRHPIEREVVIESPEGEPRILRMTASRLARPGRPTGSVAAFHDVTAVRKLEKVRRDFVANASHELRTPLTSIQGFAKTLLDNGLETDDVKQHLEIIARNAERLGQLVGDLLALSRIEGGETPRHLTAVDLGRLCDVLRENLAPQILEKSLAVSIESQGVVEAWVDPQAADHILTNLLENAVRYTDPGGQIRVRFWCDRGLAHGEIADTGIGIPKADLERIFERFYRVDKARSRLRGGTGLGLAIVKHLVQSHEGSIEVESEEGHGSTFRFTLPAAPEEATDETGSRRALDD